MAKTFISLALFFTVLMGCGKSEVSEELTIVDVGTPAASVPDQPAPEVVPPTPPGTMEMPQGIAVNESTPPPPTDPLEKKGGFEMPSLEPRNAPVMVKRPVLDDVVTPAQKAISDVTLTAATLEEIRTAVAKSGQVCVVDYWSLACEPCLKEFPGLVRLNEELPGKVTCLSVNVDYDGRKSKPAETYRPRVKAFLQSTGAAFQNFLCLTPNEDVYADLKIVSIPAVLVYDASGKLVRTFTDAGDDVGFTYAKDIAPLVQSLVTK